MQSNFVDYVKINCRAGHGGPGSASLHREKYIDKGGPDGGDGGRGGNITLVGNSNLWTLLEFRFKRHFRAQHGGRGGKSRSTGADGEDIILEVPIGVIARDEEGNIIGEVTENGQELIIAQGGKGGLGNRHFRSATRQTPRYAQPGIEGEERQVTLELKILADVGLVGFPNAGKSTLLSAVSAAKPKIADYAFTTLTPNLGIVDYRNHQSFIMADIPGIIEGAAEGKGLGHRFLRHIERNSTLLFLIPADAEDYAKEYEILLNELTKFNPELLDKERILAISKSDMLDEELENEIRAHLPKEISPIFISSVSGKGITELKDIIWKKLHE